MTDVITTANPMTTHTHLSPIALCEPLVTIPFTARATLG